MFFYLAGNEVKQDDGFTMTMMYNRNFILEIWFPMLVFDIIAIVFLSIDFASCPGDPLWIWSLLAMVTQIFFFYCIALCATINYSYEKFRLHANVAAFVITGAVAITGAIVLFLPKLSCDALLYSGLWIWAIFAFTIVGIAFIYYGIITYLEHEEVRAGRRKRPEMTDYLLHRVMNVQPDADPDVHRFDVTTRKPISCQRRGCMKLGTVLCAACQQASYCSSECLFLDFKGEHKYMCGRMRAEALPTERRNSESFLGTVRTSSFVADTPFPPEFLKNT